MSQPNERGPLLRRVWPLPVMIALGAAIALTLIKTRPSMEHRPLAEPVTSVRTVPLEQHAVRPSIVGYGQVIPDLLLDMRAEVSGRVTFVHPRLKKGVILPAGTLVVELDDSDHRLALKKAEASLAQQRASLAEQYLNQEDAKLELQLAQEKLRLAETELVRFEKLLSKNSIAASGVDSQRSSVLKIRQEVQSLNNRLKVMPHTIDVIKAQIDIAEAELQTQELNLERTQIRLPFNGRIVSLATEANQFVSRGASLFSAQTIDKVLINAQVPLNRMRFLSRGFELSPGDLQALFERGEETQSLIERLGLTARVRLAGDGSSTRWSGDVERISSDLDPVSRTVGVFIGIDNPYGAIEPGVKPPLIEGMYMEVELQGQAQPYWVVPRSALHEGELYLMDDQRRLQRLAVTGYPQQQVLLLDPALEIPAGTQVITSDLFPAVEGMPLAATADAETEATLRDWLEAH